MDVLLFRTCQSETSASIPAKLIDVFCAFPQPLQVSVEIVPQSSHDLLTSVLRAVEWSLRPLCSWRNSPLWLLDRRLRALGSRGSVKEGNFILSGIEFRVLSSPAHNIDTIVTELFGLSRHLVPRSMFETDNSRKQQ